MGIKAVQRERLQRAVSGAVLLPGEGGYADATRTWDLAVGSCPPVALVAASAADIAAGARWAKRTTSISRCSTLVTGRWTTTRERSSSMRRG
jgi:hypothetical protein